MNCRIDPLNNVTTLSNKMQNGISTKTMQLFSLAPNHSFSPNQSQHNCLSLLPLLVWHLQVEQTDEAAQ